MQDEDGEKSKEMFGFLEKMGQKRYTILRAWPLDYGFDDGGCMEYVAYYFGITLIGYLIGSMLRKQGRKKSKWVGRFQGAAVTVLIFVMASRIGSNEEVLRSMGTIGFTAFVTVVFALAGSLLFVFVIRNLIGLDRKGVRKVD